VLSGKYFHYDIGYNDGELFVTVTHMPTGLRKARRPRRGESVAAVQQSLVRELRAGLVDERDFAFHSGRCAIAGRAGDWYAVEHLPTKRTRSLDSITRPDVTQPHDWLLDALVEELWHQGILPKQADSAEPGAAAGRPGG
jgi:hypothetical protein